MLDQIDRIRARRPSPTYRVIPEVDAMGRLTDLYIAPGTLESFASTQELVADIMAAIQESTADAMRQHEITVSQELVAGKMATIRESAIDTARQHEAAIQNSDWSRVSWPGS
ncbi:hypothetical protein AB4305_31860 [Nocardia sp. 2YAB30]|uniref:hypothetical protein n=1 Tax=Nocardia sp. 2YAB30 TaxID=3233022 RepID=UPI003F98C92E